MLRNALETECEDWLSKVKLIPALAGTLLPRAPVPVQHFFPYGRLLEFSLWLFHLVECQASVPHLSASHLDKQTESEKSNLKLRYNFIFVEIGLNNINLFQIVTYISHSILYEV